MNEESGQPTEKKSNIQNLKDTTLKNVKKVQDSVKNSIQPATCYFQATQKKIELALLTRTIANAQNALGKTIDTARESGLANVFENPEVKSALENLDQLKQNAAKLTEEIEALQKKPASSEPSTDDTPKE